MDLPNQIAAAACRESSRLTELLAGRLNAQAEQTVANHLAQCAACQQEYERLAAELLGGRPAAASLDRPSPTSILRGDTHIGSQDTHPELEGSPAGHLPLPERIGPYRILRLVGAGGMGRVYEAEDERLRRTVAVKVLAPHLVADLAARERMLREAQAAAALSHDHIVTLHGIEEFGGQPCLVMQFIQGESLQQRLSRGQPISVAEIVRIGREISSALAAAHDRGLIHRDIKPANILIEGLTGRARITDFGLVRVAERAGDKSGLTQWGMVAGTPAYMAPEQARGGPIDASADLFALGGVLYALATGQPPRSGTTSQVALQAATQPLKVAWPATRRDVPQWLKKVIEKLLAPTAEQRFASAADVQWALERGAQGDGLRSRPVLVGLAIAGVAAALLIGAFIARDRIFPSSVPSATSAAPAVSVPTSPSAPAVDLIAWKDGLRRAEQRLMTRDYVAVEAAAEELIALDPRQADGYYYRGLARSMQDKLPAARGDLQRAVELMPDHTQALAELVDILVQGPPGLRDPAAAIPLAQRAVEIDSRLSGVQLRLGAALLRVGREEAAASVLTASSMQSTRGPSAYHHVLLAQCFARRGDLDAAVEHFRQGDDLWMRDGATLHQRLRNTFFEWRTEAAKLLAAAGRPLPALRGTAQATAPANEKTRNPAAAPPGPGSAPDVRALDQRLQTNPSDVTALRSRSTILRVSGRFQDALADAQRVVDLAPQDYNSWCTRGMVYERLGNHAQALADYRTALKWGSRSPAALRLAATMLALGPTELQDFDESLQLAKNLCEASPRDHRGPLLVGIVAYRRGDYPEAMKSLEQSCRLKRSLDAPLPQLFLAMAQQRAGQREAARGTYDSERAWFDNPNESWITEQLALALQVRQEAQEVLGLTEAERPKNSAEVKDLPDRTSK